MRRPLALAAYSALVLGLIALVVFVFGTVFEIFRSSQEPPTGLSFSAALALGGLCAAAILFVLFFVLVGFMLARQTRLLGSGYGDAYRLIEQFRFRDAIPLLERSIEEGKETADVLMLLTSAYAYTGQLARAQATADRAVQLYPNDPDSYVTLANGYRLQASFDEAARALQRALELSPDQPIIQAELGFVLRFAGDHAAATEIFEKAAEHAMPASYGVRVYYHLARAYESQGRTKDAVRATAKMMSARSGLTPWRTGLRALEGTAYGQALRYEIADIEQAVADADSGNLG
jgi:tetratricopeptide (TPR) repeat protein